MIDTNDKNNIYNFNRFCPICDEELDEGNIARRHYTYDLKKPFIEEIRTDSQGLAWCQSCVDAFDNKYPEQ